MKLSNFKKMPLYNGIQVVLKFGEKYDLSIVSHEFSYGGTRGAYEIAVFKDGHQVELPGITSEGDTVKGFLTEFHVNNIIKKMYTITGEEPVQI